MPHNFEKFQSEIKLLQDFATLLDETVATLQMLGLNDPQGYDAAFVDDMATILTQAAGPLAGKESELRLYAKHRLDKFRTVIYQGKIADVAVDYGNGLGKAIQSKSSYQDDCATINNMIKDAANQLTGERGETPRAGDRWVIDMAIRSPTNPWPFSQKATYGQKSLVEYITQAKLAVHACVTAYAQNSTGLSPAAVGKMTDLTGVNVQKLSAKPANTRMVAVNPLTGATANFQSLTVKIRYEIPYPLNPATAPLNQTHLSKIAFEVVRVGVNLQVIHNTTVFAP